MISSFSDGVRHKVGHSRQYQSKHHHEHHLGPFFEGPLNTTAGALHVGVHLYTEAVLNCRVGMLKDKTVRSCFYIIFYFFLSLIWWMRLSQSVNFIYYRYLCRYVEWMYNIQVDCNLQWSQFTMNAWNKFSCDWTKKCWEWEAENRIKRTIEKKKSRK